MYITWLAASASVIILGGTLRLIYYVSLSPLSVYIYIHFYVCVCVARSLGCNKRATMRQRVREAGRYSGEHVHPNFAFSLFLSTSYIYIFRFFVCYLLYTQQLAVGNAHKKEEEVSCTALQLCDGQTIWPIETERRFLGRQYFSIVHRALCPT